MNIYGIIPMRGGSKGLPGKNLRILNGRPLLNYIIDAALEASTLDSIYVSTDSDPIAELSASRGINVIRQDATLSGDEVPSYFAVRNAARIFESHQHAPDIIVTLRATSPLCGSKFIDEAVNCLISDSTADAAIAVTEVPVPPGKFQRIRDDGYLQKLDATSRESYFPLRRQNFEKAFMRTAAIYATRAKVVLEQGFWGERNIPIIMPRENSVNINDELDFMIAETLMRLGYGKNTT